MNEFHHNIWPAKCYGRYFFGNIKTTTTLEINVNITSPAVFEAPPLTRLVIYGGRYNIITQPSTTTSNYSGFISNVPSLLPIANNPIWLDLYRSLSPLTNTMPSNTISIGTFEIVGYPYTAAVYNTDFFTGGFNAVSVPQQSNEVIFNTFTLDTPGQYFNTETFSAFFVNTNSNINTTSTVSATIRSLTTAMFNRNIFTLPIGSNSLTLTIPNVMGVYTSLPATATVNYTLNGVESFFTMKNITGSSLTHLFSFLDI